MAESGGPAPQAFRPQSGSSRWRYARPLHSPSLSFGSHFLWPYSLNDFIEWNLTPPVGLLLHACVADDDGEHRAAERVEGRTPVIPTCLKYDTRIGSHFMRADGEITHGSLLEWKRRRESNPLSTRFAGERQEPLGTTPLLDHNRNLGTWPCRRRPSQFRLQA